MPLPAPTGMKSPPVTHESHAAPAKPRSHVHGASTLPVQEPWPLQTSGAQLGAGVTDAVRDAVCVAVPDCVVDGGGTDGVWLGVAACVGVCEPFGGADGLWLREVDGDAATDGTGELEGVGVGAAGEDVADGTTTMAASASVARAL